MRGWLHGFPPFNSKIASSLAASCEARSCSDWDGCLKANAEPRWRRKPRQCSRRLALPLDENDLWIAAAALAIGATLVSTDSDFQRVETLNATVP